METKKSNIYIYNMKLLIKENLTTCPRQNVEMHAEFLNIQNVIILHDKGSLNIYASNSVDTI